MITGVIIFFAVFAGLMFVLTNPQSKSLSPEEKLRLWVEMQIYFSLIKEQQEVNELEKIYKGEKK